MSGSTGVAPPGSWSSNAFNTSKWPLVDIRFSRTPYDEAEIEEFEDRFVALLKLASEGSERVPKGKVYLVFHLDGILQSTLPQQIRAAQMISNIKPYVYTGVESTAVVISNPLVRGIYALITSIQPLTSENEVFPDEETALEWITERMQR